LQRQRELLDAGIVARKDFEQAQADAARAQAELARASARTQLYGHASGVNQQLALTTGLGGVVVERNINPGQEVRPDQTGPGVPALFTVTDPSVLWVLIDARESESATLRPGAPFVLRIASLPGLQVQGRVAAVSDAIDPNTRTIKVRGVVANPTRVLKAEMLATAHTEKHVNQGLVVPAGAVTLQGTRHQVFVQTAPGVFESREVGVMLEGPTEVVLSEGVKKGERVVSQNALLLTRLLNIAQDEARTASGPEASSTAHQAAPLTTAPKTAP
jgi:membrane fusion protein, heavy metal efflux system